jgi:hypothetical protein
MGKSNNRKDIDDYGDDDGDYGDMDTGLIGDTGAGSMSTSDPAQAATAAKTTTMQAKMSSQKAKQQAKRSNQTGR